MVRSMSGFGRAEARSGYGKVMVEIRSLNHRYFEFSSRLPNNISVLEGKIKECICKSICRGKINLYLQIERVKGASAGLSIDKQAARNYYKLLNRLKKDLKLNDNIRLDQILSSPNVLVYEKASEDAAKAWPLIEKALIPALNSLVAMRESEGRNLKKDLVKRIGLIETATAKIGKCSVGTVHKHKTKLLSRIKELSKGLDLDKKKIAGEIAIFAERSDITEELTRLAAHLSAFKKKLSIAKQIGRTLDFIIQEMNREINTISAKANSYNISKQAILIKNELEKIREQVQNIE
ncbi:MAG: YicC/YloC family endoribonuclease [Candidatus Omnitrophota bacterium]|nr:YicC/YloC family endoribonuclease [Candidatus Omnitrophota bacterium]